MRPLARLATLLGGLVAGAVGLLAILPLGLIAPAWLVVPLALAVGALAAALAAGWLANWLAGDGTRTRLLPAVAAVEATGLAAGAAALVAFSAALDGPLIVPAGLAAALLGASATVAAWRLREPAERRRRDLALSAALVGLALAGVVAALALAGLFGLLGA